MQLSKLLRCANYLRNLLAHNHFQNGHFAFGNIKFARQGVSDQFVPGHGAKTIGRQQLLVSGQNLLENWQHFGAKFTQQTF